MNIDFANLQLQYLAYKDEIDSEIKKVLDTSSYIMGESIYRLEESLSKYVGTNAIACSSGTDAIILALMASGIGVGDEVITTPFTFIATAEAIAFLGARSVFVDIDENTYNIDVSKIKSCITPKTKAILPVSLYGCPSDMDEINQIAEKYNLLVIEDACQSFGATYKGKKSCNISPIALTSFFPSKPLGCYGDGGAIFCSDLELQAKLRSLLNHGQTKRYHHKYIGLNARMDSIQASILCVKLKYLDDEIAKRVKVAKKYSESLENVVIPKVHSDRQSVYAQYSIRVKNRDFIMSSLQDLGIPTAIHYPLPLHLQDAFSYLGYKIGDFEISEKVSKEIISLPMSAFLPSDHQDFIISQLNKLVKSQ